MSSSIKTDIIVRACIGIVLLLCVFISVNIYLFGSVFTSLEQKTLLDDVERIISELNEEVSKLDETVMDWAEWDDSVHFMNGKAKNYIQSNLNDNALDTIHVSLIVFINNSNGIIFSKCQTSDHLYSHAISPEITSMLFSEKGIIRNIDNKKTRHGFIYLDGKLTIISCLPIVDSEGQGPKAGFLVMGRCVESKYIEKLSRNIKIRFDISNNLSAFDTEFSASNGISQANIWGNPVTTYDLTADHMAGVTFLQDILHQRNVRLVVYKNKDTIRYGYTILAKSSLVLVLGIAILLFLTFTFINKSVVKRIVCLKNQLMEISHRYILNKYPGAVSISGNDELSLLAEQLNFYITESHQSKKKLETLVAELETLASTDSLTNTNNRRRFLEILQSELARATRYMRSFALLLVDIDNFKDINDTYGHPVGDQALTYVANIIKSTIRKVDSLGRLGGEEFGIVVPELERAELSILLKRLIDAFSENTFCADGCNLTITISVGAALFPSDAVDIVELLKLSDKALYSAKNKGKNQYFIHDA